MELVGDVTGCSLAVSYNETLATITCEAGGIHFQNGVTQRINPCSISVPLGNKDRHVRVYITGAYSVDPLMLPGVDTKFQMSLKQHNHLQVDDGVGTPRGAYPAGLVVLGHVDIPAKQAIAASSNASDKPLDARERATLLNIIGALADEAKLDLSQHIKAGDQVAAMLAGKGITIAGRTIGNHLKSVREAMDSRKKV